MITGVAFCPHPPLLLPEVAQGAAAELDDLRAACRAVIERVVRRGSRLVVLGSGSVSASFPAASRGTLAGFGVPLELTLGGGRGGGSAVLPLSLTVGAWLLRDALGPDHGAAGHAIGPADDTAVDWDGGTDCAVLAMGDGSARRSVKAPGYLDARAERWDAGVADALGSGAGDRLHLARDGVGEQLLASCTHVYEQVATVTERLDWDAELLYDDAPYGVGYFVASWTLRV